MYCGNTYAFMISMVVFFAMPGNSEQSSCNGTWNDVSSLCTINATCSGANGLSITIKGTDFPMAGLSEAYAHPTGTYNTDCAFDLSSVSAGTEVVRLFNNTFGGYTCVTDNSTGGTLEGFITTLLTLKYGGEHLESGNDVVAAIVCEYSKNDTFEPSDASITTGTFNSFNVTSTDEVTLVWENVTMEFVSSLDEATVSSIDVKADIDDICIQIKVDDSDIPDFNIASLTFQEKTTSPTKTLNAITSDCVESAYENFFSYSAFVNSCTAAFEENCPQQRTICFKPFRFNSESNLVAVAELVRLSTPGKNSTCSGDTGIGRKRRDVSDDGEVDDTVTIKAILRVTSGDDELFVDSGSNSQTMDCNPSTDVEAVNAYLITIIVLAAVVLALGVLIAYVMVVKNCKNKEMSP